MIDQNKEFTKNIAQFLVTRETKVQDAWDNLNLKRLKLDRKEEEIKETERRLKDLKEDRDMDQIRVDNAIAAVEKEQLFYGGPQSIHWFCKKNDISFYELKQYLAADSSLDPDIKFLEQLQFCIDNPGDKEYKGYK